MSRHRVRHPSPIQELGELYDWECHYCNRPVVGNPIIPKPTIDHVIPRSAGGTDDPDNLVLACHRCNSQKHTKSYETFVETVRIQEFWRWEIFAIARLTRDDEDRLGFEDPGGYMELMWDAMDGLLGKPMPGYVPLEKRLGHD